MQNENQSSFTIRVPMKIAKEVMKLKDEQNLPSVGSAIQVYIESLKVERIEKKLNLILEEIKLIEDRVTRTDEKANLTAWYMVTILDELDGKGGLKPYADKLEKIIDMDIGELLKERAERHKRVQEHKKS